MSALEDLQAAEAQEEAGIAQLQTYIPALVKQIGDLTTELANTHPDDSDALHVLTAKIMANVNAIANMLPPPATNTAGTVAAGGVVPPSEGGVTTDPTGGLVADPTIPPGGVSDGTGSIPATPGDPANPLPAGDLAPVEPQPVDENGNPIPTP